MAHGQTAVDGHDGSRHVRGGFRTQECDDRGAFNCGAEATERRGPHQLTNYAIYVADDFHRFYHEHIVLESKGGEHEPFRLALVAATREGPELAEPGMPPTATVMPEPVSGLRM